MMKSNSTTKANSTRKSEATRPTTTLSDEDIHSLESDCFSIDSAEMARFRKTMEETLEADSVDLKGYKSFRRSSSILDPSLDPFDIDQDWEEYEIEEYEIPLQDEPSLNIVVEFDEKLLSEGLETTKLNDSPKSQRGQLSSQLKERRLHPAAA